MKHMEGDSKMDSMIRCLTLVVLLLCLLSFVHVAAYYSEKYMLEQEYYKSIHNITSEGPDYYTYRWYLSKIVCEIDDAIEGFCDRTGSDGLLIAWRNMLEARYNTTMY